MDTRDKNDVRHSLQEIRLDTDPSRWPKIFGDRFNQAWTLYREKKVKKHVFYPSARERWTVEGTKREYLTLPEAPYCDCFDYYFHVIDGQARCCKHLLAQRISAILNKFQTIKEDDHNYRKLMGSWSGKSEIESR